MRVLFLFNEYGLVDKDILDTMINMGIMVHQFNVNPFNKNRVTSEELERLTETIMNFQPDFLFSTNDVGLDVNGTLLNVYKKMGLTIACWFVDEPSFLFVEPWLTMVRSGIIKLFMIDRYYVKSCLEVGISQAWHLPLGTNLQRFKQLDMNESERLKYQSNVTFVGRLGVDKMRSLWNRIVNKGPKDMSLITQIIDETCCRYLSDPNTPILSHIEKVINYGNFDKQALLQEINTKNMVADIYHMIDFATSFKVRMDLIPPLATFGLRVYGERTWGQYIPDDCLVSPKDNSSELAVPYNGKEIVKIYQASHININITKLMLKTTVNQRVFDVPACGGFLLTDYREDLEKFFQLGKEMVCYRGLEDLEKKVSYFLENSEEREAISLAGQRRVRTDHGYEHRLEFIFEKMH